MAATIIDGKAIAARLRADIAREVADIHHARGIQPHLAAILVGDDPASAVYVRNKERDCEQAGIRSTLHRLSASTTQADLLDLVQRCNADASIHGILVQLPLPAHIDSQLVLDAISPLKDVDAFHAENVGLIAQGRPRFVPCTPYGVHYLLEESGTNIAGAHAVILGRSNIVGKPLALLLMQKGADATVTVCHSRTRQLPYITRTADIVIAAMGVPAFVTGEMIKPGAVVIDVGTTRVGDKFVGDVNFASVSGIASAITPVPGGVGPMTRAMLLKNTLTATRLAAGNDSTATVV